MGDLFTNLHLVLRWVHVLAGVLWIGLALFVALVSAPAQAKLAAPARRALYVHVVPRALFWLRAGSVLTLVFGLLLFTQLYMYTPAFGGSPAHFGPSASFVDARGLTDRAAWIQLGMTAGVAMWLVAWLVVFPAQRRLIDAFTAGRQPEAALEKRAASGAKAVLYLAAPMLFGMLAPSHYGAFSPLAALGTTVFGVAVVAHLFMIARRIAPPGEPDDAASPKPHEAPDAS